MDKKALITVAAAVVAVVVLILVVGFLLRHHRPLILQGRVECTTYRASSKIAGRIAQVYVSQGQHVTRGQLLYTLTTPELDAKLRQAEAARMAAEAMDQKAIAGTRSQQITAARSLWEKAQAGTLLSQRTYERVKSLYDQGVVPAQKFDEAQSAYAAAQATEAAARAEYDLALAGASSEDREAAAAQLLEATAAVSEVQSYIGDAMVYAPATGEVTTIVAEQGELVGSGYPVVTIAQTEDQWVTFNVRETLLPRFEIGMTIVGYVPALDSEVELVVSYISAQADFATWNATRSSGAFDVRSFAIKARPKHPTSGLRHGMSFLVDYNSL